MPKLGKKEKILGSTGIVLVIIGLSDFIFIGNFGTSIRSSNILHYITFSLLPIVIGLGLVILTIIMKKRKQKSNFEKKEKDQTPQRIKEFQENDTKTPDSEKSKKCNVCGTTIPGGKNVCPNCGDTYS